MGDEISLNEHKPAYVTSYKIGQDNVKKWGLDVHNPVFVIAALITVAFVIFTLLFREQATTIFGDLRVWLTTQFDWFYLMSVNFFLLTCFFLICSPLGNVRIGGPTAIPDFSYLSWFAMMFAAGLGIGLMFYGVLEPVNHTLTPPLGVDPADTSLAREYAISASIFHWSLHAWGNFAIVGLALAIFFYNKGLPLTIRSAFYPLLGEKIWGWPGHIIDILAVFATLFGLATSLGLGAEQVSGGLYYLFNIQDTAITKVMIVIGITIIALISVLRGLNKGVKRLSEINVVLAAVFCLFVILVGPTLDILLGFFKNTINYVKHIPSLSNWIGREDHQFVHGWTSFYWAWWIAWAPFVGMFIARVSKGRSVREFLTCALLAPSCVCVLWMSAFGDSAINQFVNQGYTGVTEVIEIWVPELALFKFLEPLPFTNLTSTIGIILVVIFFITSMDSGSLVVDTITAGGKINAPVIQRVFWCCFEGLIAIALLLGGGLVSLQALSLIAGFPFCIIMLFMVVSLYKGLKSEL